MGVQLSRVFLKLGLALIPFMSLRLGTTTLSDIFLIGAIFTVAPSVLRYRSFNPVHNSSVAYYVIFMSGLASSLLSLDPANSVVALLKFFIMIFGYTFLIRIHLLLGSRSTSFLNAYLYGSSLFAIQYIVGYYTFFQEQSDGRFEGLSDHVTNAAGSILIGVAINLNTVLSRHPKLVNLALQPILMWALILTGSISSFIAFTITLLVAAISHSSAKFKFLLFFSMTLFLVSFLIQKLGAYDFVERFRSATSGRYNTSQSRIFNWKSSLDGILSSLHSLLLGSGLDKDSGLIESKSLEVLQVHNSLLQLLYQGGLIFSVGVIVLVRRALSIAKRFSVSDARVLVYPCVSALFFSMTSPLMNSRYIWFPFLLSLANFDLNMQPAKGK